jgi:hypothetical protein
MTEEDDEIGISRNGLWSRWWYVDDKGENRGWIKRSALSPNSWECEDN